MHVSKYLRFYPNGFVAGHIIGYTGRNGRPLLKPIENNDLLWPEAEGREGIESTFNAQLTGKLGQMNIAIDANGKKISQKVAIPPVAGDTVVTTIDLDLQKLCEQVLSKSAKRGAIVMIDPNNGDILAMASWPVFNPNDFAAGISGRRIRQGSDKRPEKAASAARLPLIVSAGIDLQGTRGNRSAGERGDQPPGRRIRRPGSSTRSGTP